MSPAWVEAIGYLGSVLIALSMMSANVWRLRWINLAGSLAFVAYGLLLEAYPVALTNIFIAGANLYHLHRLRGR